MPRAALLLFAKIPVPGRVKTRLFGLLSPEQAAEVHRACLLDVLELCEGVRGAIPHLYVDGAGLGGGSGWWHTVRPNWRVRRQIGSDLGARLTNAFASAFAEGYSPIVAIGTDTPWMGRKKITRAFEALAQVDVVLGPSRDGGYYLVGARRSLPGLFRAIPWGTREVLKATRRALDRANASYRMLPADFDLDRPGDLRRAAQFLVAHPERALHLARALRSLFSSRREFTG